MSIVKVIPDTLLAFSPKLRADLNLNAEKDFDSFLLYLDLCSCMIKNKLALRDVLNLILKENYDHVKELVNKKYPLKVSSERSVQYSKARKKFQKKSNQSASDNINTKCNKILAFLIAIKENTIDYNPEYKQLQSIHDAERKEPLEAWIQSLPSNEWFQGLLKPEALADETLFLAVIHCRNNVKDVSNQVIHAVQALSKRHVVDLTEQDVDEVIKLKKFKEKPLTSIQKQTTIDLVAVYKSVLNAEAEQEACSSIQNPSPAVEQESSTVEPESVIIDIDVAVSAESMNVVSREAEANAAAEEANSKIAVRSLQTYPPEVEWTMDTFLTQVYDSKLSSKDILFVGKRLFNALEENCRRRNKLSPRLQLLQLMIRESVELSKNQPSSKDPVVERIESHNLLDEAATEEAGPMIVDDEEPVSAAEQQLVTAVDRDARAVADVNAATEEAGPMIVDDEEPLSAAEQQLVTAVDRDARAIADVNAATEEAGSISAVSSVQNHSRAVQLTMFLDLPLLVQIFNFVHPHLHHIVCKSISMSLEPVDCTCKDRLEGRICTCKGLLTRMPPKLPYSLYVRASLYTDTSVLATVSTPGYPWINKSVWTAVVKDASWCMGHFRECSDFLLQLARRSFKYPTCKEAYQKSVSKELSPLWLHWARKNHCSCIYDLKSIRHLSLNEKEILTWLEKHARGFQRGSHFQHYFDTPIPYGRRGNCLWSTFMEDRPRFQPKEDFDDECIVDRSLMLFSITEAASAEIKDCSKPFEKYLVDQVSSRRNGSRATSSATGKSIWSYSDTFNKIVNSTDVCIVNLKGISPDLTAALTVFAHAIRLEILQNNDLKVCEDWCGFISEVYGETRNLSDIITEYGADANNNDIIQIMLKCIPDSRFFRDRLHRNFVTEFRIEIALDDTTASIATKLCSALNFNADTGLYLCRVEHVNVGTKNRANAFVPLLIRKDGQCFQSVACIYRTVGGDISFHMITRSLQGLLDDQYITCHYMWKPKTKEWSKPNSAKVREDGQHFNTVLHSYQLYAIVLIPTVTQRIHSTEFNFSMKFFNEEEERISDRWTVRDQLSLGGTSHLTESVLRMLVFDLVNKFGYDRQSIFVSANFIDDLRSYMELGNDVTSTNSYPPMSDQMARFAEEFLFQKTGVIHLFFSYKHIDSSNIWVYSYYILEKKTLVILSRRSDPVREILAISSSIKQFLQVLFKAAIIVQQILWRNNELCHGNSGYYALKQFWKNADNIKRHFSREYLCMIQKFLSQVEQCDQNNLMLKPITIAQLKQLKTNLSKVLSSTVSAYYYYPKFLQVD